MSSKDDPLEQTQIKGFVLSLILTAILFTGNLIPSEDQNAPQVAKNKPNNEIIAEQSFVFLNGNTLLPTPIIPETQVLGMSVPPLLYKIIDCESDFRPNVCNKEFGCGAGMGLAQFIKSTWLETIERMGELMPEHCRTLEAVFDGKCNLKAATWLLSTDGHRHWGTPTSKWGSYHCWGQALDNL